MTESTKNPFSGLEPDQIGRLQADVVERIRQAVNRIHYAEGRRGSFAALAIALLAAGVALLATLLANADRISFRPGLWSLVAAGLGALVTGGLTLLVYASQTNFDYPFKGVVSTWKWFYRDAVPNAAALHVPWSAISSKSSKAQGVQAFQADWNHFVEQELRLVDEKLSAEQDVKQLFVLYANEFYKNRFLSQIRSVLALGLIATGVVSIAALIGTWVCSGS